VDVGEHPAELDSLMAQFFAAVSFDAGARPPYELLLGLFLPGGLLIRNSGPAPEVTDVGGFITSRRAAVDAGDLTSFSEAELGAVTESFGQVAQRFSTYTKSGVLRGEAFAARGVICTQFVRTPDGWRIASMAWDDERPGLRLPGS
jgi:hypothetical protein